MFKEIWFRGLSKDDKELLKKQLMNSMIKDQLSDVIIPYLEGQVKITKSDYDCPSWSHKQAHVNGMTEVISTLKSLLTQDQKGQS